MLLIVIMIQIVKCVWKMKYLVLFTLFAMNLVDQPTPEVKIAQGTLIGVLNADGTVFEYLGIPYASTNSSTRFQAPLPPPSWDGTFKANEDIYLCAQRSSIFGSLGSEDCLRMNIYVPALTKGPFPVMFSIHGGAFILGSGGKLLYGPEFLINEDVILVSFNYRLGALGFLCLGTKEVPGNAGLKDQVAALRWVKENISAFGGDPDNITIIGESAGGTSVALLLASKSTEGLFKRAIVQSGSSISNWAINMKPLQSAILLAKELGYNTEDPNELYTIFSTIPYKQLTKVKIERSHDQFYISPLAYLPCVEKSLPGVEYFITDLPYNILSKNPKNVPVMFGTTSREGLFFIQFETDITLAKRNRLYPFSDDLKFSTTEEAKTATEKVNRFYFNNKEISKKNIMNLSEFQTHLNFEMPVIFESELYLQKTNSKVFNYYFNYSGWRNFLKLMLGYLNEPGSCHGDELMYMFKGRIWPFWISSQDQKMIKYVTKMWTNFAKFGDPTPASATDLPVRWTRSNVDDLNFLYIEDTLRMGSIPNPEAYAMWKDIYSKHRRKSV